MISYEGQTMNGAYHTLLEHVQVYGRPAGPRGLNCLEIRPYSFTLYFPDKALYTGATRRLNYRFFAVETLMYMAGWGELPIHTELLVAANKQMGSYVNKQTGLFDGAYGPRLKQSMQSVYELLQRDPYSRQAVASIWSPGIPQDSKDVPCTLNLHFFMDVQSLTSKYAPTDPPALGMHASMRSNDLNWGTPYDAAAFATIQITMAGCLGWELGSYTHTAGSFHIYTDKVPKIKKREEEVFRNDLLIPDLGYRMCGLSVTWREVEKLAGIFLYQLYNHAIVNKEPWHTFHSPLEDDAELDPSGAGLRRVKLGIYWRDWANLIRFRWAPEQCEPSVNG